MIIFRRVLDDDIQFTALLSGGGIRCTRHTVGNHAAKMRKSGGALLYL